MARQSGNQRTDDLRSTIREMIDTIRTGLFGLGGVSFQLTVDAPENDSGEWWIDVRIDDFETSFSYLAGRGFGLFTSNDDSYGSRPNEIYRDPELVTKRLVQLSNRGNDDSSLMNLDEVRKLLGESQSSLALSLEKDQGYISRLERQGDARLSTLRRYVQALGGEIKLVARFNGFEAPIKLPDAFAAHLEFAEASRKLAKQVVQRAITPNFGVIVHVRRDDSKGGWKLVKEGSNKAIKHFHTKSEAIASETLKSALGRTGGMVMIHKANGQLQEKRSYSGSTSGRSSRRSA